MEKFEAGKTYQNNCVRKSSNVRQITITKRTTKNVFYLDPETGKITRRAIYQTKGSEYFYAIKYSVPGITWANDAI